MFHTLAELTNLVELDLSQNFFDAVPVEALTALKGLRFLNLGSNKIRVRKKSSVAKIFNAFFFHQTLRETDLQTLSSLEYLDLSRNLITGVVPGTFLGMANLKGLDFSVNDAKKVRKNATGAAQEVANEREQQEMVEDSLFATLSLSTSTRCRSSTWEKGGERK